MRSILNIRHLIAGPSSVSCKLINVDDSDEEHGTCITPYSVNGKSRNVLKKSPKAHYSQMAITTSVFLALLIDRTLLTSGRKAMPMVQNLVLNLTVYEMLQDPELLASQVSMCNQKF